MRPHIRLNGEPVMETAMRELARRHAQTLQELGEVRVLALDPCPRCMGCVIASDEIARCASGCGWAYIPPQPGRDPVASRKAPA